MARRAYQCRYDKNLKIFKGFYFITALVRPSDIQAPQEAERIGALTIRESP